MFAFQLEGVQLFPFQVLLFAGKTPVAAAGHINLVSRKKTTLASMTCERTERISRRAEVPPPEEAALCAAPQRGAAAFSSPPPLRTPLVEESQPSGLSGPCIHAPCWLKVSFFLKTKVLCPAAASGRFVRPQIWSRSEVDEKNQHFESSQNGVAYSGKS